MSSSINVAGGKTVYLAIHGAALWSAIGNTHSRILSIESQLNRSRCKNCIR